MANLTEKAPLILVVDDDAGTRLLAEAALRKAGYAVVNASDGEEGVAACERHRPDLVLMDAVMPGMDGFTAVRRIREMPGRERMPIVMMTGLDDLASIQRAYEVGITDFATKPVNWVVLGYRVGYILASSRAFLDLARSEEKTRALVRAIPDLIFRIGDDGTVLDLVAGYDGTQSSIRPAGGPEGRGSSPRRGGGAGDPVRGDGPEHRQHPAVRVQPGLPRTERATARRAWWPSRTGSRCSSPGT